MDGICSGISLGGLSGLGFDAGGVGWDMLSPMNSLLILRWRRIPFEGELPELDSARVGKMGGAVEVDSEAGLKSKEGRATDLVLRECLDVVEPTCPDTAT